jgi:hypothetical protein
VPRAVVAPVRPTLTQRTGPDARRPARDELAPRAFLAPRAGILVPGGINERTRSARGARRPPTTTSGGTRRQGERPSPRSWRCVGRQPLVRRRGSDRSAQGHGEGVARALEEAVPLTQATTARVPRAGHTAALRGHLRTRRTAGQRIELIDEERDRPRRTRTPHSATPPATSPSPRQELPHVSEAALHPPHQARTCEEVATERDFHAG